MTIRHMLDPMIWLMIRKKISHRENKSPEEDTCGMQNQWYFLNMPGSLLCPGVGNMGGCFSATLALESR